MSLLSATLVILVFKTSEAPNGEFFKKLRPASYKGVPFGVFETQDEFGRVTVVHEFPSRDHVYVEDMGRAPRRIEISAFVVGPGYEERRDALVEALNEPGPGTLVHPWLGSFNVSPAAPPAMTHSAEEGGLVIFELKFIEDAVPQAPGQGVNLTSVSYLRAAAAKSSSGIQLDNIFQWLSVPVEVLSAALGWVDALSAALEAIFPLSFLTLPPAVSAPDKFHGAIKKAGGIAAYLDDFWPEKEYTPQTACAVAEPLLSLALNAPPPTFPPRLGTVRRLIAKNQAALNTYLIENAAIEGLRALAFARPESRGQALTLRTLALKAADRASAAADDDTFRNLQLLHAAAQKALALAAGSAPDLNFFNMPRVFPSLNLAWRLVLSQGHGHLSDVEADLLRRNQVRHPAFVPAGNIEVLSGQ